MSAPAWNISDDTCDSLLIASYDERDAPVYVVFAAEKDAQSFATSMNLSNKMNESSVNFPRIQQYSYVTASPPPPQ